MSPNIARMKKITSMVTVLSTFLMGVPIQADQPCPPPDAAPVKTGDVTQAVNYLKNQNNCNGIITRADEVNLLKQVGSINEKYLDGKTDLKARGEELSKACEAIIAKNHLTGDAAKAARAQMLGDIFGESTGITENVAKLAAAYAKNHGGKVPQAFIDGLARMGKVSGASQYIHDTGKPNETLLQALNKAGAKQNDKGSWDLSGMKLSVQGLQNSATLTTALANSISPQSAAMLRDPKRSTIVSDNKVVFLPPKSDGSIKIVSADDWKQEVKNSATNLQKAMGAYLSTAQAENTTAHSTERVFGHDQKEVGARADAQDRMYQELQHLQQIGFPSNGIDELKASVKKAQDTGASLDQQGREKFKALEKAVITTASFAGGVGLVAMWGRAGEAGGVVAEVADIAKGAQTSSEVLESLASTSRGAADYQRVVREAMGAVTYSNMAPMAFMPFGFSSISAAINAGVDLASGKGLGTTFCRMTTEMTDKFAQNLMMANFAWATPAAALVGGAAEVASGGAIAADKVAFLVGSGQGAYFNMLLAKSVGAEGSKCYQSFKSVSADEEDVTQARWAGITKTCAQAGVDTTFLAQGGFHMFNEAAHSEENLDNAKQTAADRQQNRQQRREDKAQRSDNVDAAKDRAATGMLRAGEGFKDADGNSYTVTDSGFVNGKATVVAMNDKTAQVVSVPAERLQGGKAKMSFKVENEKLAQAQAAYESLPGGKPVGDGLAVSEDGTPAGANRKAAAAVEPEVAEESVVKPSETVGEKMKKDTKLAQKEKKDVGLMNKLWEGIRHNDAKLNDEITMKMVVDDLKPEELEVLDKKLEMKPEEVKQTLEDASVKCAGKLGARNDDGAWDPEGNFKGILYAQNSASCIKF
jgi:hypothetical protein